MITITFPTVNNITVNIEAEYQGAARPWNDKYDHAHFNVTVTVPGVKEKLVTNYYTKYGTTCIDGFEAASILQCLLQDASGYDLCDGDIDEFVREYGYDPSEGVARIIEAFNACKVNHTFMEIFGLFQYGGELCQAIDDEEYETEDDEE